MMTNLFNKHRTILAAMFVAAALILTACGTSAPLARPAVETAQPTVAATASAELKTFTVEELAKFNGKDGNPAYVAINGTVYDVTNVPAWKGGIHQGRIQAGKDQSEEIKKSPHGLKNLEGLPIMGTLVD